MNKYNPMPNLKLDAAQIVTVLALTALAWHYTDLAQIIVMSLLPLLGARAVLSRVGSADSAQPPPSVIGTGDAAKAEAPPAPQTSLKATAGVVLAALLAMFGVHLSTGGHS